VWPSPQPSGLRLAAGLMAYNANPDLVTTGFGMWSITTQDGTDLEVSTTDR
jgi:hypothetical protein